MLNSTERPGRLSALSPLTAKFAISHEPSPLKFDVEHVSPASTRQWVELSMSCLQNKKIPLARLIQILENTARALLDEDVTKDQRTASIAATAVASAKKLPSRVRTGNGETGKLSDAEGVREEVVTVADAPDTSRRWLAARFLILASRLALEHGTGSSLLEAVRLAEEAVVMHRTPFVMSHLAWTCYLLGYRVQEKGNHNTLEVKALKLALEASEAITSASTPSPTDIVLLVNLAWLLALHRETQKSFSLVQVLLQKNRADMNSLLLLLLLFSTTGEYRKALDVASHLEQLHPQSVVGGIVLIMMRYVVGEAKPKHQESVEEALAVLVARVRAVTQYSSHGGASDETTFPPEVLNVAASDASWSSRRQGARRVAGHWALLAYLALEVGCEAVADIAVEAGLEYVGEAKEEHRQAFADLICCGARLKIDRIEKLVSALRWRHSAAGIWGPAAELQEVEDERLIQEQRDLLDSENVLSLQSMLGKALEVSTAHAETYLLLGRLHLLKALKADQPHRLSSTSLVEAAHHFQLSIRCNPTLTDAYEGMGRVREAQGAVEISLSFLSSATELAYRQPVIPFERFLYILH